MERCLLREDPRPTEGPETPGAEGVGVGLEGGLSFVSEKRRLGRLTYECYTLRRQPNADTKVVKRLDTDPTTVV